MNTNFIHGHAKTATDDYRHVADAALEKTLCGKPIVMLARGLIEATCPICIHLAKDKRQPGWKEQERK